MGARRRPDGGPVRAGDSPAFAVVIIMLGLMLVAKSSRVTSITHSRETRETSFPLCLFADAMR